MEIQTGILVYVMLSSPVWEKITVVCLQVAHHLGVFLQLRKSIPLHKKEKWCEYPLFQAPGSLVNAMGIPLHVI